MYAAQILYNHNFCNCMPELQTYISKILTTMCKKNVQKLYFLGVKWLIIRFA